MKCINKYYLLYLYLYSVTNSLSFHQKIQSLKNGLKNYILYLEF